MKLWRFSILFILTSWFLIIFFVSKEFEKLFMNNVLKSFSKTSNSKLKYEIVVVPISVSLIKQTVFEYLHYLRIYLTSQWINAQRNRTLLKILGTNWSSDLNILYALRFFAQDYYRVYIYIVNADKIILVTWYAVRSWLHGTVIISTLNMRLQNRPFM